MAIIFLPASNAQAGGENGIHVSGGSSSGTKISSNIGNSTIATGYNSFASGYASEASGHTSTALGREAKALGAYSGAFGNFVKAVANNSFVLGTGFSSTLPLTNSAAGIMMGVNSQQPTLTITAAANATRTGKIAIGNVASPSAKLHIAGDGVENADILLASTGSNKSIIQFRNSSNNITVGSDNVMKFNAPNMQFCPTGQVVVNGAFKATGNITLSGLAGASSKVLVVGSNGRLSSVEYSAIGDNFGNHTAAQNINLNGKKIVNGVSGLGGIFVSTDGKVGINTENTMTAYALAVDGGLITTKVYIQDVENWPDYVFDDTYKLMPLHELRVYVEANRHLPEMPSEREIVGQGYDIEEMQHAMMKKIEELTLYTLQQQEEIEALRKQVDELKIK